jgi:hypothetical protein
MDPRITPNNIAKIMNMPRHTINAEKFSLFILLNVNLYRGYNIYANNIP